jgi:hypothetical protein
MARSVPTLPAALALAAVAAVAWAPPARAQQVTKEPAARPPLCAAGVRRYQGWAEVPTPFDSLRLPRGEPIRVTSPDEAQAAEQRLLERVASVGGNGLVVFDERSEGADGVQLRRSVAAVFVRADSARAYKACGK